MVRYGERGPPMGAHAFFCPAPQPLFSLASKPIGLTVFSRPSSKRRLFLGPIHSHTGYQSLPSFGVEGSGAGAGVIDRIWG